MRAAAYARVSTERQERQQTIDSQLSALRAWAEAEGHELSDRHVFRDEVAIADRSSELEVIEADGSPGGAEVEERDGIPTRVAVDGAVWLVAGAGMDKWRRRHQAI